MRKTSSSILALNVFLMVAAWGLWPWLLAGSRRIAATTDPGFIQPDAVLVTFAAVGLVWSAVGRVIHRRELNSVGWVLHAIGLCLALPFAGIGLSIVAVDSMSVGSIVRVVIAWTTFSWGPGVVLIGVVLPLLFPTGRPPSPRWRWVGWVAYGAMFLGAAAVALHAWQNPIIFYRGALETDALAWTVFTWMFAVSIVGALASAVFRYRAAGPVERRQIKWVLLALIVVGGGLGFALTPLAAGVLATVLAQHVFAVTLGLIPVSIGVAITRYRLFEIDRILSRTLAYTLVVALLGSVYFGAVAAIGTVLPADTSLAVAGSTLLVAALFNPFQKRILRAVDRRFNRTSYQMDLVLSDFSAEVGKSLTTDTIIDLFAQVVHDHFQPRGMSVGLK